MTEAHHFVISLCHFSSYNCKKKGFWALSIDGHDTLKVNDFMNIICGTGSKFLKKHTR